MTPTFLIDRRDAEAALERLRSERDIAARLLSAEREAHRQDRARLALSDALAKAARAFSMHAAPDGHAYRGDAMCCSWCALGVAVNAYEAARPKEER